MKFNASLASLACACLLGEAIPLAAFQQGPTPQSSETVAKPRKKAPSTDDTTDGQPAPADAATPPEQQKIPSKFTKKENLPPEGLTTFKSDVTTVQVDVSVLDAKGRFIPKIPRSSFRILEDNVPQQITTFATGNEAPMTVALVIEFSNLFQQYYSEGWYQTLMAAYGFVQTLKPDDYVAVVAYDLRTEILSDFSTDRNKTLEAMQRLRIAGFSEANLFDALTDTAERMTDIEGRKAIILIASGRDTFSKLTFDKARKRVAEAAVPVYAIGLLQTMRELADARGNLGALQRLDFLQADSEMKTFAKESGGQSYFPRFYGEFPTIYQSITESLRSQYSLAYQPSNQAKDGKYRKLKVELINPDNNELLSLRDEKGKPIKYQIIAKQGYTAPREVE
jgi:Ca-activated chloride channel family protein